MVWRQRSSSHRDSHTGTNYIQLKINFTRGTRTHIKNHLSQVQLDYLQIQLQLQEVAVGGHDWWGGATDMGREGSWYWQHSLAPVQVNMIYHYSTITLPSRALCGQQVNPTEAQHKTTSASTTWNNTLQLTASQNLVCHLQFAKSSKFLANTEYTCIKSNFHSYDIEKSKCLQHQAFQGSHQSKY